MISLDKYRDMLGQLHVIRTYYDRLSERERYIVLGSISAGVIALMVVVYATVAGITSSVRSKIDQSRENLAMIQELRQSYVQTQVQFNRLEQEIQRTPRSFQLATHLERLALQNGVKIDSIKERPGAPNDLYREKQVAVTVRQINLRVLTNYLYEIEQSKELMRISSLRIKPNFQDPTQLNVEFVVSTFQPVEPS